MKALKYTGRPVSLLMISLIFVGCSLIPDGKPGDEDKGRGQMNLGNALLLEAEYSKALVAFLDAQEMMKPNADLENFLGLTYYGMKEYGLATKSYLKALELDPKRTDVRNNLGLVYLALKDYTLALAAFKRCSEDLVYQKKYLPLTNMGLTYFEMGNYDEATAILAKAMEVAPDYSKSYQIMGQVYLALGKIREASDYFSNAIKLNPDDPEIHMFFGDVKMLQNRPEEAAVSYSQVTILVPNTPMALEAQKKARVAMGFD